MPIEFPCPECNQFLKTPDESAGQKAKCPMCSAIVDVPLASQAPEVTQQEPPPLQQPPQHQAAQNRPPVVDTGNPYAAPQSESSVEMGTPGSAPLTHTKIEVGVVIGRAWNIFKDNIGPLLLYGLILIGVGIVSQVVAMPAAILPAIDPNNVALFAACQIFQQIWGIVAGGIVMAVAVKYIMAFLRGDSEPIRTAFNIWPVVLKAMGVQLLFVLLIVGGMLVFVGLPAGIAFLVTRQEDATALAAIVGGLCYLPVYFYLIFSFMFAAFFVVDKDSGVFQAFSESSKYSSGNKLAMFAILIVVGFLSTLVTILTCFVGTLFAYPFGFLTFALIYVCATGQWQYTKFASTVP